MASADLELKLYYQGGSSLLADLRFAATENAPGDDLAQGVRIRLDPTQLLAAHQDSDGYGQLLSRMVFASEQMRYAWERAESSARKGGQKLRVRLRIDPEDELLHGLQWETLVYPGRDTSLALSRQVLLSRYLTPYRPEELPELRRDQLRALIVVASPDEMRASALTPINVQAEVQRAREALAEFSPLVLARPERQPTLKEFEEALEQHQPDIVYIACHGMARDGETFLLLEHANGAGHSLKGRTIAQRIEDMPRRPRLMVLAVCHSDSGGGAPDSELTRIGPRLVRAGVPAVVAMRGAVSFATIAAFTPTLFHELRDHGQIDRAMARARTQLADNNLPWWMPVLTMRLRDGALWQPAPPTPREPTSPDQRKDRAAPRPPLGPDLLRDNDPIPYHDDRWMPAPPPDGDRSWPGMRGSAQLPGANAYRYAKKRIDELLQADELSDYELDNVVQALSRALEHAEREQISPHDRRLIDFERARYHYLAGEYRDAEALFRQLHIYFIEVDDKAMAGEIDEYRRCIDVRQALDLLDAQGLGSRERKASAAVSKLRRGLDYRHSPLTGLLIELLRELSQSSADLIKAELLSQNRHARRPDERSMRPGEQEKPGGER